MGLFKSKVAANASWIIIGKIAQSMIALIVNMFTARYLGPSNYGLISYAASIVAFAVPLMNLGFANILVQEYTNFPEDEGKITCTSICFSAVSAVACIVGIVSFSASVNSGETQTTIVVFLYSILLIFQAFELIQYWFQAKLLSKYMAIISFGVYCIIACYKILLLVLKASINWFAISNAVEFFLIATCLYISYRKLGGQKLQFSLMVGKRMFARSKHYIISSLMVTIFAQTDKVMLKAMIDETAVGYYSAAVSCAGMTSFVFGAIIDSFRPAVFQYQKKGDFQGYEKCLQRLYSIVIYVALIQSLCMTILAKYIIRILYGTEFIPAVLALQIVVWYTTFAYMGSVRNIWILGENKQKYLWILNLAGALLNIILNALLINLYGLYGAAVASLITQFFVNVVMNVVIWPLRHNNTLILRGLNLRNIIELIKR